MDLHPQNERAVPDDLPQNPTLSYKTEQVELKKEIEESVASFSIGMSSVDLPGQTGYKSRGAVSNFHIRESTADEAQPLPPIPETASAMFTLHRRVGMGGNGEIWAATQHSLQREIAIKRLKPDHIEKELDPVKRNLMIANFHQEAITTANLEHPNIVPVHDLGLDEKGQPLLVMKMVRGKPWSEIIALDEKLTFSEFISKHLNILIDVAQAVAFAHSKGIIHRDLKPSQVMLGEFGEVILVDWGLAFFYEDREKILSLQEHIGLKGLISTASNPAGTPAFMAPEQTERTLEHVGPWTDIFLLGGILYFLLTKTAPYREKSARGAFEMAMIGKVEPPDQRAPNAEIPDELAGLAMRAMATHPKDRIPAVQDFVQGLKDYLSGVNKHRESAAITKDVESRIKDAAGKYEAMTECLAMLSRAEILWHQNPDISPLREQLLTSFARLAIANKDLTLAKIYTNYIQTKESRQKILREIEIAQKRIQRAARERRFAFAGILFLLMLLVMGTLKYIDEQKKARAKAEHAHEETKRLKAAAEHEQYLSGIASADAYLRENRVEKTITTLIDHVPATLRNWEWGYIMAGIVRDDMLLYTDAVVKGEALFHSAFSPDGKYILTGQNKGKITKWDASTGQRLSIWQTSFKGIWTIEYSPDGNRVLVCSTDGKGAILDSTTGKEITQLPIVDLKDTPVMRGGDFSPDGTRVVTTGNDKIARVSDAETGKQILEIKLPIRTYDAHFSPDGSLIAVAILSGGQAVICDSATGEILQKLTGHDGSVYSARFNADGTKVVTSCTDRKARIFNPRTGKLMLTLDNPEAAVKYAAFHPFKDIVATSADDGVCRVWDVAASGTLLMTVHGSKQMEKLAFHPDGTKLITTSFDEIKLWDIERNIQKAMVVSPADVSTTAVVENFRVPSYPFDRDINWRGYDKFWLQRGGRTFLKMKDNYYRVDSYYTIYSPDNSMRLAITYETMNAVVYQGSSENIIAALRDKGTFNAGFSHNGKLAATTTESGELEVWDTSTWKRIGYYQAEEKSKNTLWSFAFSPDDNLIALGWLKGGISMWSVQKNEMLYDNPKAHVTTRPVANISFSADGKYYVSSSSDETAKVWETTTGRQISTLKGHDRNVITASFSPDGSRVVTSSFDNRVKLWETETGREILTVKQLTSDQGLMFASFNRLGNRIIIIDRMGELFEINSVPWIDSAYPGSSSDPFERRMELWKRRNRLSPHITMNDIGW